MTSFVVPVPKFSSVSKFPSDMLILKHTLLFVRPQYSGIRKSAICVRMGKGG